MAYWCNLYLDHNPELKYLMINNNDEDTEKYVKYIVNHPYISECAKEFISGLLYMKAEYVDFNLMVHDLRRIAKNLKIRIELVLFDRNRIKSTHIILNSRAQYKCYLWYDDYDINKFKLLGQCGKNDTMHCIIRSK
jgi:hypothetical protein